MSFKGATQAPLQQVQAPLQPAQPPPLPDDAPEDAVVDAPPLPVTPLPVAPVVEAPVPALAVAPVVEAPGPALAEPPAPVAVVWVVTLLEQAAGQAATMARGSRAAKQRRRFTRCRVNASAGAA